MQSTFLVLQFSRCFCGFAGPEPSKRGPYDGTIRGLALNHRQTPARDVWHKKCIRPRRNNFLTTIQQQEILMAKTVADVMKMVKENEVKFVDFRFTD
ncbi:MAG: hypothetical protein Q7T39_11970, partial [Polaromonas sp.]|nr:hypothetical protein [Polaromonas sp.]